MNNHNTLFTNLMKFIFETGIKFHDLRVAVTFVWAIVGAILSESTHLSHWQLYRPGEIKAASKSRQFSRWLHNKRINPREIYSHLVKALLSDWVNQEIYLALDTTLLWKRYVIVRVALVYCGRAIPLGWVVKAGKGSSVHLNLYQSLLEEIAEMIPRGSRVILLADRAFSDVKLFKVLKQLGWHFRIRLKNDYWIYQANHASSQVAHLMPPEGHALCLESVWITQRQYGPLHVALAHAKTPHGAETWAIASDEPCGRHTFDEYGLRFCIEENFLDDKSAGFNLEDSGLEDADAISRLCLVIASATIYLVSTGKAIESEGWRDQVDTHWFRGLSYIQIGWRWCKRAVVNGLWLLDTLVIPPDPDHEPAIACWKQFYQPHFTLHKVEFR